MPARTATAPATLAKKRATPAPAKKPAKAPARPADARGLTPTGQWPAEALEHWAPARLAAHPRNARTHSPEQIGEIVRSMETFGWTMPILVDEDGVILAGHARFQAAGRLGYSEVPVIVARGWSDTMKRAYMLADNRLPMNAGWDEELLSSELKLLVEADVDLSILGFNEVDLVTFMSGVAADQGADVPRMSLAERFGIVPFSVLNAREGWWQDRKRAWLALGIQSEVGRGENLGGYSLHAMLRQTLSENYQIVTDFIAEHRSAGKTDQEILAAAAANGRVAKNGKRMAATFGQHSEGKKNKKADAIPGGGGSAKSAHRLFSEKMAERQKKRGLAIGTQDWVQGKIAEGDIEGGMSSGQSGTSIFDPVLCELAYRWFCPVGGQVLDPFAGGSVRGVVASRLGRDYHGVDLRPEQVAANEAQAEGICKGFPTPQWSVGDSRNIDQHAKGMWADFLFSCPPYADLEVYSENPLDISTMEYAAFRTAYTEIIAKSCALLKPDRFACFVVGDARDKDGLYYGFPAHTIEAFAAAGLRLYNEAVLVTAAGSLPVRVGKQFAATRKLGKTHQNVLVFVKGNPKRATKAIGEVEFGAIPEDAVL